MTEDTLKSALAEIAAMGSIMTIPADALARIKAQDDRITALTAELDAANARADAAEARVAGAYLAAATEARSVAEWLGKQGFVALNADFHSLSDKILSLTLADADAALRKLIRDAEIRGQAKAGAIFATSDAEGKWISDTENFCPACSGSGHKDDAAAALRKVREDALREAAKVGYEAALNGGGDADHVETSILALIGAPK